MLTNPKKTELDWTLYLIEAIFKSNAYNRDLMIKIICVTPGIKWAEMLKLLKAESLDQINKWLSSARKSSESADRICLAEGDFDIFIESYQGILKFMAPGFPYDSPENYPENSLQKILEFSNGFGIPRVKLRLLLQFTGYAECFDSGDIKFLYQALEEIEDTLACMPDGASTQINGQWFYAQGINDIRSFIEDYEND